MARTSGHCPIPSERRYPARTPVPDRSSHRESIEQYAMIGRFYEFFAGGGMVRAGLGDQWRCLYANDIDQKHTPEHTAKLLAMMSDVNLEKVRTAARDGRTVIGTVYKRTRRDDTGRKVQRAEVRFDGVAGCLRTPAGGSSRQLVVVVRGRTVRSCLISGRETARLMGLPDDYVLPVNYNEAYHLTGDGVVVPVVRFLAEQLLEPVLLHRFAQTRQAA